MKIIIHSLDELVQLTELIRGGASTTKIGAGVHTIKVDASNVDPVKVAQEIHDHCGTLRGQYEFEQASPRNGEPNGLPTDIKQPTVMSDDGNPVDTAAADVDGAPYSTDWHSDPAKLTAKGLWRARRGRDEDAYKAWLLEGVVEVAELAIAADEAGPVATETHALPAHLEEMELVNDEMVPVATQSPATAANVDLEALIAASQEAALDASDSHVDLLNACRDFTSKHGHPAFTALKAAVAPDGDSGQGKTVQHLTPGERRLMQACIANYPG